MIANQYKCDETALKYIYNIYSVQKVMLPITDHIFKHLDE